MNITVYLASSEGNSPAFKDAARALGQWIGESGNALVYGGAKCGLMGELAESVLTHGGEVTGVEPQFFIDAGFEYDAITRLIVTRDMPERKAKMIELGEVHHHFPRAYCEGAAGIPLVRFIPCGLQHGGQVRGGASRPGASRHA